MEEISTTENLSSRTIEISNVVVHDYRTTSYCEGDIKYCSYDEDEEDDDY